MESNNLFIVARNSRLFAPLTTGTKFDLPRVGGFPKVRGL